MDQNQPSIKTLLSEKILPKAEKIGVVLIGVSILFKILHLMGFLTLSSISLIILSIVYFLYAQLSKMEGINVWDQIIWRVGYISSSVTLIGVMFALLGQNGGLEVLSIGSATLGIAVVLASYKLLTSGSVVLKSAMLRFLLVLLLGISSIMFR